ncbi:MAG: hypothetical protein M3319_11685 [Actinomycetota bacterium]|nr:hypothetical protein [Actinomycetota bacterium]
MPDRSLPVKHSVVPGEAASKAGRTSSAWLTVRVQAGGAARLGPADEVGPDGGRWLVHGLGATEEL